MTNNGDHIKISKCAVAVSAAYLTGCSGEFHVVSKHFTNLLNLILNILNEKFYPVGSFFVKIV